MQHLITGLSILWRALGAFAPEKVISDLIEAMLDAMYNIQKYEVFILEK